MKIRAFATACLCLLVMGVTRTAAATTWIVDDDGLQCLTANFSTITAAVAAASPGDTIKVCPGKYLEQVQINKNNLTLLGAQSGVDARTRPFVPDPTTQSIIDHPCGPVQIMADKDTLDGFTIQGSALPDPCYLSGIWTNPGFSGTQGGHRILNNIVQSNISGIELDSTCINPTLVQFNLIQNNSNPGNGSGNGIQTNFGLCDATIDSNKFSGDTSSSVLVVASSSNLHITNNQLVGGTPESIAFLNVSTATINGNVSSGSTSFGTIDLFGGDSDITVNGNTLFNGVRAILVENPYVIYGVSPNSNIAGHLNCIQGNSIGMEVDPSAYPLTPQLNAEQNWWGHPSGPNEIPRNPTGVGDKILDPDQNVDFDRWLMTPPTTPSCPPVPPPPNTPGKVTGGGQIPGDDPIFSPLGDLISVPALVPSLAGPGLSATFGFVAKCCAATGQLEYNDHQADVRIKAKSVDGLFIGSPGMSCPATPGSKHARFTGTADVTRSTGTTTERFAVDVDDCGEPGTMDTFGIRTASYSNGPSTLIGGNIQIH